MLSVVDYRHFVLSVVSSTYANLPIRTENHELPHETPRRRRMGYVDSRLDRAAPWPSVTDRFHCPTSRAQDRNPGQAQAQPRQGKLLGASRPAHSWIHVVQWSQDRRQQSQHGRGPQDDAWYLIRGRERFAQQVVVNLPPLSIFKPMLSGGLFYPTTRGHSEYRK